MESTLRALLIEDDVNDAELLLERLSTTTACELLWVSTLAAARLAIEAENPDVVIVDLALPDARDLDAVAAIKALAPHLAVVVLTGNDDEEDAMRALQHGAQDYLIKGRVDRAEVLRSLRYAVERQRFEQERELFLSAVGHDLRTPLGAVRMAANLMLIDESGLSDAQRARVVRIANSTDRMNRLIEQLLSFARVRSGTVTLHRDDVDLASVVALIIDELALTHPAARIVMTADDEGVVGRWDRDRLVQVVQNLLANAVVHGTGAIDVRVTRAGGEAILEVENGGDVSADGLKALLKPFRRARPSSTGLGLGLAIVQQLVVAHGGTLTARTQPGRVIFAARLPIDPPAAIDDDA